MAARRISLLKAVSLLLQIKVCEDECCHAFDNHGSADGDARIVPAPGGEFTILVTSTGGLL
jgi:hypothetical protein